MKIKSFLSQHRRDFTALMVCEFCKHEWKNDSGYDDRYYHDNVIPAMKCQNCGKSSKEDGGEIIHTATKYTEGFQI